VYNIVPTTAEKLEAITDPAKFEILAIRALREIDGDCRALVHLGVNASGKTIPGPIDGFVRVPDSFPAKYVITAFTITAASSLQGKWLNDGVSKPKISKTKRGKKSKKTAAKRSKKPEIGDLIKAADKAASIRSTDPAARFVIYLCTNQKLDLNLMALAYAKGKELSVEVRFLDQTLLGGFLDGQPYGQWLRHEYLGTAIALVSRQLLEEAAVINQREYAAFCLLVSNEHLIPTKRAHHTYTALHDRSVSTHLLLGVSGVGKSVLALDLQKRVLEAQGLAFWIPQEVAERSLSAADALETVLRSSYPSLETGSGQNAVHVASSSGPLILIVDDINRTSAPTNVLSKILRWGTPTSSDGKSPALPLFQIVCPLWPSHWTSLSNRSGRQAWLRIHTIQSFLRKESVSYLRTVLPSEQLTEGEAQTFAELLKDDPILLALFVDTISRAPDQNRLLLAQNVLQSWSTTVLKELSDKTFVPVSEYMSALEMVAETMIAKRVLYPEQRELAGWFAANHIVARVVGQLAEAGHICYLRSKDGVTQFQFRHDRLLEFFITAALSRIISSGPPYIPSIWDPYFAIFLGRALAVHPVSAMVLDQVQAENPVALVAAVSYFGEPGQVNYKSEVLARARAWLQGGRVQDSARWHYALSLLQQTLSDDVLTVTDGLPRTPEVLYGRFRNGDVEAGVSVLVREFLPAMNASWLDSIITHALSRHEHSMVVDLEELLTSEISSDNFRCGALILAGYIGSAISEGAVYQCWQGSADRKETVQAALWATLRCKDGDLTTILRSMLDVILEVEEDPTGKTYSKRHSLLQGLGWSSRYGFTDNAIYSLLELAAHHQYRTILTALFAEMRSPLTTGFVVREIAEMAHKAADAGGFSPFAMSWSDNWKRWRDQGEDLNASIAVLYEMWRNQDEPSWLREYALRVWTEASGDIDRLREISSHDALFAAAVWFRVRGGDSTIGRDDITFLPKGAFEYIARIWKDDFLPILERSLIEHFASLPENVWSNEDFRLAHTLRDIPAAVSEALLIQHWEKARVRPLFVQLALYLSTEQTLQLAADALLGNLVNPLEHIDSFFGFSTSGLVDRLSTVHLDSLAPHLSLLSDGTLADMIEFCGRHGHLSWAKSHLASEITRRSQVEHVDNENMKGGVLERVVSQWMPSREQISKEFDWIASNEEHAHFQLELFWERFGEQGGSTEEFCQAARNWFDSNRSESHLLVFGVVIQYWGKRSDLPHLESAYAVLPPPRFPSFSEVKFSVMCRSLD
jgi:hypothetical protein